MRWLRRQSDEQVKTKLILTTITAVWTDCCGYVPNTDGVGAPVYILAQDEHLSRVDTDIQEEQ